MAYVGGLEFRIHMVVNPPISRAWNTFLSVSRSAPGRKKGAIQGILRNSLCSREIMDCIAHARYTRSRGPATGWPGSPTR